MSLPWVTILLQTADALFPTGAYAHSLGFEEAVRLGLVRDEETLGRFLGEHIVPALTHLELPYLRLARAATDRGDFPGLCELDREIHAARLARETREAGAQLGVRRLKALRTLLPQDARLLACDAAIRAGEMAGQHVIICGVQAAVTGIPLEAALSAYFYQAVAAVGSASLKLIRIGQDGVQRAVFAASQRAEESVRASLSITREDAGWFGPLLEIASMRHERAHERLFIS